MRKVRKNTATRQVIQKVSEQLIGSQENSVFLHSQLNKNNQQFTMLQNRVNILVNTLCRSTVCFERMPYVHTLGIESFGRFKKHFPANVLQTGRSTLDAGIPIKKIN